MKLAFLVISFALLTSIGCGGGVLGDSTGAVCAPGSTVTYTSFARDFMLRYCTRCHSSILTGGSRNGAPLDHDLDSLPAIRGISEHVDQTAGSGPDATNDSMPPDGAKPTLDDRQKLAEWIACDMPQ